MNTSSQKKNPETVLLKMQDLYTGKEINREIDISNIYVDGGTCWKIAEGEERQRELLNNWIEDRGNEQHNTELDLISWSIH